MAAVTRIRKVKAAPDLSPAVSPFPVRRFTVEEYHRMLQYGILIDGESLAYKFL
jgi:hypothetical protein